MGNSGASTSKPMVSDDAVLARLLHDQDEMRSKLKAAVGACKKVEILENEVRVLRKSHDDAVQEAETWKKEALRTGNKRSHIATSPASTLKMPPATTPRKSPSRERTNVDTMQLRQLHNLEVETLKELRLQELNRRREAEQENERMKEELAKRDADKRVTPKSSFREKLDEAEGNVGGSILRTEKGKKKPGAGNKVGKENDRESFIWEAKKEFRNLKKDDVMDICMKEGVKYTTLSETITEIISKRAERAFGKKAAVQDISDDVAGEPQNGGKDDGRDSATS
ncbi:hypothetical protein CBR_g28517 [Chara braunii]|uniref:Uncharacterized protein n=1 Tax=Chara braunii TaxID=69332 RepID=A0A388JW52_CHABU|nr:hypothetical protein CBR_g28517 [Chara braunii]|eukprot:GBG62041.1 hypothetical protein CBR_g28517 [Chara braunii]